MDSGTTNDLYAVSALNPDAIVAAGLNTTLIQYNGTIWSDFPDGGDPWGTAEPLGGVALVAPDDIWVGSRNTSASGSSSASVALWNGVEWGDQLNAGNTNVRSMWFLDSEAVFVSGSAGRFAVWDGSSWSRTLNETASNNPNPPGAFSSHGSASNNIWAVGTNNQIWRNDNGGATADWDYDDTAAWSSLPLLAGDVSPTPVGVFTLSSTATFVVGAQNGEVALWDGTDWSLWEFGGEWNAVYADAVDNAWIAGSGGRIFHYDGEAWTEVLHGLTTATLRAIDVDDFGQLYVVGDNGVILMGIPEPGSLLLLSLGAAGLLLCRRRKRRG